MNWLLLDGDMLLMRAATATEVEVQLDEDVWTRHSQLPEARQLYWKQVEDWCDQFSIGLDSVLHCFTDTSTFRRELYPAYKQNRKSKPKPIGYKQLRSEILSEATAYMFSQIEADDLMGIFATMPEMAGDSVVMATGDKDLMQIPGVHVWIHNGKEPDPEEGVTISYVNDSIIKTNTSEHAERFTYEQYLSGDATDGVPGCPGLGPVGARRAAKKFDITKPVDCWEAIVRTYETKGEMEDARQYALTQARLVRILRAGEYDFATHTVNLWTPTQPSA
jgi:DNA polymerase-1